MKSKKSRFLLSKFKSQEIKSHLLDNLEKCWKNSIKKSLTLTSINPLRRKKKIRIKWSSIRFKPTFQRKRDNKVILMYIWKELMSYQLKKELNKFCLEYLGKMLFRRLKLRWKKRKRKRKRVKSCKEREAWN